MRNSKRQEPARGELTLEAFADELLARLAELGLPQRLDNTDIRRHYDAGDTIAETIEANARLIG